MLTRRYYGEDLKSYCCSCACFAKLEAMIGMFTIVEGTDLLEIPQSTTVKGLSANAKWP